MADRDYFRKRLLGTLAATWTAQACSVFAILGLADRMAAGSGDPDELADAVGADPSALRRLLAALADAGVLRETAPERYALSPVGEYLRTDVPGSVHATAVLYGQEVYRSFGTLLETVRTGRPGFADVHGQPFYAYVDAHPEFARTFNGAMSAAPEPPPLPAETFDGVDTVVDVGGGDGGLLVDALRARPGLRGVLVELPEAAARARQRLADAGVLDRVRVAEGSFFDPVPGGGDLYVLRRVLHNWNDANAGRILATVRAAMPAGARLLVVEELLPSGPGRFSASAGAFGAPRNRVTDLLMLVLMEGRDRTAEEYAKLLRDNGFTVKSVADGAIEAAPS